MLLTIFKVAAGILTVVIGLYSMVWPTKIDGFTGVTALNSRGVTEIRTIFGAVFIGLGAAVLWLRSPGAYQAVGITYLALGIVRVVSMLIDKSVNNSNIISAVVELGFGVIFLV